MSARASSKQKIFPAAKTVRSQGQNGPLNLLPVVPDVAVKETSKFDVKFAVILLKGLLLITKQNGWCKQLTLSNFFHTWRFNVVYHPNQSHGYRRQSTSVEEVDDFEFISDQMSESSETVMQQRVNISTQKQNYLTLFAENEKLREQLSDVRKSVLSREKSLRASGGKSIVIIFFRSRLRIRAREFFDRWHSRTQAIKVALGMEQQMVQLEVGLQRVESNTSYLRETEKLNLQLQKNLMCTLFFLKWKTRTAFATLTQERKIFNAQKRQFLLELQTLKEAVLVSNQQEALVVSTSLTRGADVTQGLESIRSNLGKALRMHKSLNEQLRGRDQALASPAATATAAASTSTGGTEISAIPTTVNNQSLKASAKKKT